MTGLRRVWPLVLAGACSFTPGQIAGGGPSEAGVVDAPGDGIVTDGQIDAMTGCGSCDDGNPCTEDECTGTTCSSTPFALPVGCGAGALFSCTGLPTCYARCPSIVDWNNGEARCFLWDGNLATVTTDEIATCVGTAVSGARVWIGYRQLSGPQYEPSLGWGWISGTFNLYTNWIAGQPNNATDEMSEGQDCAFSEGTAGEWYDHECNAVDYAFVCER